MSDNWNTFVKMKEKTEGWDRYSDGSAGQVSEEWSKANKSKMKAAKPPSEFSVGRKGATQLTKAIPKTGVFLKALGPIGAAISIASDLLVGKPAGESPDWRNPKPKKKEGLPNWKLFGQNLLRKPIHGNPGNHKKDEGY